MAPAAPTGGVVASGVAAISQSGSPGQTTTTITQSSGQASLNWQSFNISKGETVNFIQPSTNAVAVNRISDVQGSQILGQLNANGQVWLINPHGLLFGKDAQVNVGALVASTLEMRDSGLSATTFSGGSSAQITNLGNIQAAPGGYVALVGHQLDNQGIISTAQGTTMLGAGNTVRLQWGENRALGLEVQASQLNALAANAGLIQADGGQVLLSAGARDSVLASVVNNTGVVQARSMSTQAGRIVLLGGMQAGTVALSGTLDASAPQGGDGGFIETSAASVKIADSARISTVAPQGLTGSWLIDPTDFTVAASGGNISGAALSAQLATTNSAISLPSSAAANVYVNDVVSWTSGYSLTLNAQGSIYLNAPLTSAHASAKLILKYGQTGAYYVNAPVSLAAGVGNFQTQQGSNAVVSYTVITALGTRGDTSKTTLQGMAGGMSVNYALGADINAAATSDLNSWAQDPSGWLPIGTVGNPYAGQFDGLGHTVSNLYVYRTGAALAGFFGQTKSTANIRNLGLADVYIRDFDNGSYAGGLVGINNGSISNSYVSGLVVASKPGVAGTSPAFGLGGLVGTNTGVISNSYSVAKVSTIVANEADLGSSMRVGALVGSNTGTIGSSYAAGEFLSNASAAFIGGNSGTVSNSYWESKISSAAGTLYSVAGNTPVAGANTNPFNQAAYSLFDFASTWTIYGGYTRPLLRTFLTPVNVQVVSGAAKVYDGTTAYAGGSYSYTATGSKNILGTASYFLDEKNVGNRQLSATGLYSDQQGYLISLKPATSLIAVTKKSLTITANNASKTYGDANPGLSATVSGFVNGQSLATSGVTGAGSANTSATQPSGVGSYSITAGVGSLAASNYDFSNFVDGTLSIGKAHLTVTASNASKTYGDANPTLSATVSGFVNGQSLATSGVTGAGSASTAATQSSGVGSYSITAGIGSLTASNYDFTNFVDGTLSIEKRALSISANNANKIAGEPNPLFSYTVSADGVGGSRGLVNGDRLEGSLRTSANAQSIPGTYVLDASTISNANYLVTAKNGIFTITPRIPIFTGAQEAFFQPWPLLFASRESDKCNNMDRVSAAVEINIFRGSEYFKSCSKAGAS